MQDTFSSCSSVSPTSAHSVLSFIETLFEFIRLLEDLDHLVARSYLYEPDILHKTYRGMPNFEVVVD